MTRGKVDFRDVIGTGLYDEEAASRMPGWFKELNGEHIPETEEYGISSFVYRRRKPFHPQRLMDALNGGLLGVVRSKGLLVGGQSSTLLRRLVASKMGIELLCRSTGGSLVCRGPKEPFI